jgi:endonuclease/exonuclease/phosphatase family metal-dependent hydrolase
MKKRTGDRKWAGLTALFGCLSVVRWRLGRICTCLAVLAWLGNAGASAATAGSNTLVIASWNVENLFDPADDPDNPGDDEYTPRGWTGWTPVRYTLKLDHLAEIIAAMRPDILCLAEVESRQVLVDLSRVLRDKHAWDMPVIVHRDGHDTRGIDVAMLARWAPASTNWLTPHPIQRDVLIARFESNGCPLTVICNHWKSRVGKLAECNEIRTIEARAVRAEVARLQAAAPGAAIVAVGDFNDNVDSDILTREAGFTLFDGTAASAQTGTLHNLAGLLPIAQRGTFYYSQSRTWNSFDSASVSRGMLPAAPHPAVWQVSTNSYGPFVLPQQRNAEGHPLPFRRVRKKDPDGVMRSTNLTGYADHFPIRLVLRAAPQ